MDKIIIEDLQVYAHHGVAQEEKAIGQMFIISIEIGADLDLAAKTDDLHATISYAEVCDEVQNVLQAKTYSLIEAAALQVIEHLFKTYPLIEEIKVRLKKPWAPMGHHLKYAAVELQRKKEDKHDWL
ncbi:dihydroneopterin aldolase [Sphaerochaeta pleomorpha str. Grapes]|uniref:7,8-dihydroneopterin aldolase n=1 Tax=Sphaerochaeta pleomorpha (strain ATCC BAA-1885 / DSM 22778 / Grapes) TaxID=158190 RepID=G8QRN6_SPHPG|nr:dihydroneopterin aldolase [Sphaerochaeta pleomorpha]AEV28819.1 dihydroneopterin aldolase [Sphaerochaeta pleomorpha str. Grapes]